MTGIKEGSLWSGSESQKFRIIHIVERDGETWVHYRNEPKGLIQEPAREYSCYLESFTLRFRPVAE
jgi:hypothetical protein